MKDATHFIEVWKDGDEPLTHRHIRPINILALKQILKSTKKLKGLRTVAIFKIKVK